MTSKELSISLAIKCQCFYAAKRIMHSAKAKRLWLCAVCGGGTRKSVALSEGSPSSRPQLIPESAAVQELLPLSLAA